MGIRSKPLLAIAAAATLLAVTPVLAAPSWRCTAKNARGATFTQSAIGIVSATVRVRAEVKALAACRLNSHAPATCYIVGCTKLTN